AKAVKAEEEWVSSLPFKLRGYFDALGSPTTEGTATLTIRFKDDGAEPLLTENPRASFREPARVPPQYSNTPSDEELAALFRAVGAVLGHPPRRSGVDPTPPHITNKEREREARTKRVDYKVDYGDSSGPSTNTHLAMWIHN